MDVHSLPHAEIIGQAATDEQLEALMRVVLKKSPRKIFYYYSDIVGGTSTGIILLTKEDRSVPYIALNTPLDANGAARLLLGMSSKEHTQYPAKKPSHKCIHGWEIQCTHLNGEVAVIAWAVWITT